MKWNLVQFVMHNKKKQHIRTCIHFKAIEFQVNVQFITFEFTLFGLKFSSFDVVCGNGDGSVSVAVSYFFHSLEVFTLIQVQSELNRTELNKIEK